MSELASQSIFGVFLAFCRIGACFMILPGFSSTNVPIQVRLFLVAGLSIALTPIIWADIAPPANPEPAVMARLIVTEALKGGIIGLVVRFYTLALEFIGAAIAMSIGFGNMLGQSITETEPQAAFGTLISLAALIVLFTLDFHHDVIMALVRSYMLLPVDGLFAPEAALSNLVDSLTDAFLIVLRLGSPFIIYSLAMNLISGLLNKLTPQIPIYFIFLPLVIFGGLVLAYFALPVMLSLFGQNFAEILVFN